VLHVSRLKVSLLILESKENEALSPSVHWLIPLLERPAFESVVASYKNVQRLFFNPEGIPSRQLITALETNPTGEMVCMVGPERDLVDSEKQSLDELGFSTYALTPSILRSELAVTIGMGLIRTLL